MHEFNFDVKTYRQIRGGAIGLDLTGVVSDIYMNHWDQEVLTGIEREGMNNIMYDRYKDDVNYIVEVRGEDDVEGLLQRRTVNKMKNIAEEIDDNLKVTVDAPFNHEDEKQPMLDVKIWIGKSKDGITKVLHQHYIKEVSSRALINANSAHSDNMKKNVMINEIVRILKNCSVHLQWDEIAEWVAYFVKRLQFSGYTQEFRHTVVTRALARYDKRVRECIRIGTMYPILSEEEKSAKKRKRNEWYARSGKYESIMFVEATPGGELRNKVQKLAERHRVRVKVVERVSTTVKKMVQKSDPFPKGDCGRGDCEVCPRKSNPNTDCRTTGCVYELTCKECDRRYRGTTSRSVYHRTKTEVADWRKKVEDSPLWKHSQEHHNGNEFDMEISVMKQCFGKPSRRRISEAVLINELPNEKTMNSKQEWSYIKLSKVGMA